MGTPATIMLHGLARGLMCHEGGHLFGLQHEHQRIDRNNFIEVNFANVIGGTNAAARNVISGNAYTGVIFQGNGTTNNLVQGNYVGTDSTGSNAVPNGQIGIGVWGGATGNLVGGTNAGAANLASGNLLEGIIVSDVGTSNNLVQGNLVGTDPTGKMAVANGDSGVVIENGANNNLIGGLVPGAGNLLSGNTNDGIIIGDSACYGNVVQGNLIGVDITGTNALGNHFAGIGLWGASTSNLIGGTTPAAANVISGNGSEGIFVSDAGTANNFIEGNFIGTGPQGTNAVPNGYCGVGVWNAATGNLIGGSTPSAANLVSGNGSYGVVIGGPGANGNTVQGNFIGADITGRKALANGFAGMAVWGASGANLIGGATTGAGNLISANGTYGVFISDTNTSANSVEGNFIGTDLTGTNALGNGFANVELQLGASSNFIGPPCLAPAMSSPTAAARAWPYMTRLQRIIPCAAIPFSTTPVWALT